MARASLWVTVEDDGNGFDPDNHSKGFGLQNMSAFARRSKGSLSLVRRQPRGMSIRLSIPVTPGKEVAVVCSDSSGDVAQ
jgi:signal transduction histidine kinase